MTALELEDKIHNLAMIKMRGGKAMGYECRIYVSAASYDALAAEINRRAQYPDERACCACTCHRRAEKTPKKMIINTVAGPIEIVKVGDEHFFWSEKP